MLMVIEFQKRGLPHSHILLILAHDDKPTTADDIDTIVSAEIPNPALSDQARRLHAIVMKNMVHTECGNANARAPCMQNGICSKGFPKPYAPRTEWRDNRPYPVYRRRSPEDGGEQVLLNGRTITNQFVVPYSPYLTLKYGSHINVELCCSVQSVKYLFMYVYKGHDRQMVRAEQLIRAGADEVAKFQDLRSIGASEACWRIFDFPMSARSPAVVSLQVSSYPCSHIMQGCTRKTEGCERRITSEKSKISLLWDHFTKI